MCTLMIYDDTHSVRNEVQLHCRTITTQWRKIKLSKHMKWRGRETKGYRERDTERDKEKERETKGYRERHRERQRDTERETERKRQR